MSKIGIVKDNTFICQYTKVSTKCFYAIEKQMLIIVTVIKQMHFGDANCVKYWKIV